MPPRENTMINATLDRFGRLRLLMSGSGSIAIATSVAMFMLALKNCEKSMARSTSFLCAF